MSYKYSKGAQVIGDLKAADDAQRNTLIDFGEDQIDLQTSGSTRVSVTNDGVTVNGTLLVDAEDASTNEGIRFRKTGDQYRQIVFENDSTNAAQIQLDNGEQLNIDQLQPGKEIRFRIIGGGGTQLAINSDGVQANASLAANAGIIASGSAASLGGDVTDAAIYSSGSIIMEDATAALNLDLEMMSKRSRIKMSSVAGSNNSAISLERSRASNAAVQNGDKLGQIEFYGNDGSSMIRGGAIECTVNGSPGSNDMPGKISISTTADGSSTPSEIIGVQSTGVMFNQAYTFPTSDGTNGQVLQTNGSGQLSFVDVDDSPGQSGGAGGSPEVLKVGLNSDLTLQTGTYHTLALDVVQFDTFTGGAGWNTGSYNFVATEAGYYDIQAALVFDAIQSDIIQYQIYVVSTSSASTTNSSGIPFIALNQYNNNPAQVDMRTFQIGTIAHFSTNQSASIQIRQVGGTSNSTKVKAGSNISYVTIRKL
jgi:hypothetical protein